MCGDSPLLARLPLELVQRVLEETVLAVGISEAGRLQLVCKVFQREIPGAISRSRALEQEPPAQQKPFSHRCVAKYVVARAFADGKTKKNLSARLHRILESLPEIGSHYASTYRKAVEALATAVVEHHQPERALNLLDETKEPGLLDDTFRRDCMGAAALLSIPRMFDEIIIDASVSREGEIFDCRGAALVDSPMILAAMGGHQVLLARVLDVRVKPAFPEEWEILRAFRHAISRKDEGTVRLLLNIDLKDRFYQDFAIFAAEAGRASMVRLFCEHYQVDWRCEEILVSAAARGHKDVVGICLDHGADINQAGLYKNDCMEPLVAAVGGGHVDIVRLLLARGADPTIYPRNNPSFKPNEQPLCYAAMYGHRAIAQTLLTAGAYSASRRWSALVKAAWNGHGDVVELLLDSGLNIKDEKRRAAADALYGAAAGGFEALVRLLIDRGVDIDGPSEEFRPMIGALAYGHPHIVVALLDLGAQAIDPYRCNYGDDDFTRANHPYNKGFGGVKPISSTLPADLIARIDPLVQFSGNPQ
ncbi:hypothetical protein H2201_003115 [Coniosporium apollinis]|uniref:F-box domain-containing protein n=2 Tax=Coniosporium TaxID=2810619 RepID=A0ABQ9P0A7_9PEZI|nr:hypothetical protein H2199_008456 [Cladosporium sp. JES 115]KAJ9666711.1 hypothetical protein H2201_003115 [Coniosporium apollinis]